MRLHVHTTDDSRVQISDPESQAELLAIDLQQLAHLIPDLKRAALVLLGGTKAAAELPKSYKVGSERNTITLYKDGSMVLRWSIHDPSWPTPVDQQARIPATMVDALLCLMQIEEVAHAIDSLTRAAEAGEIPNEPARLEELTADG